MRLESVVSLHGIVRTRHAAARGKAAGTVADDNTAASFIAVDAASGAPLSCVGESPFTGVTAVPGVSLGASVDAAELPVEVHITSLRILNEAAQLPGVFFPTSKETLSDEDTRLRYRFIDLRRDVMQAVLRARARISAAARTALAATGFTEVETPTLVKSTPEGAREFLVPSRARGRFYALPQSPQQHKQLLMAAGVDRYFQVARCYRDEAGRQDRQPEFTQIDLEMSFVEQPQVTAAVEHMIAGIHAAQYGLPPALPFPTLSFRDAIDTYGSDQPDLRYSLPIRDMTAPLLAWEAAQAASGVATAGPGADGADGASPRDKLLQQCEDVYPGFAAAYAAANAGTATAASSAGSATAREVLPCVKVIVARGMAPALSKSKAKDAMAAVRREGMTTANPGGVLVIHAGKWKPPAQYPALADAGVRAALTEALALRDDDLILIAAGGWQETCAAMGKVRQALARLLPLDAPDAQPVLLRNRAGAATYADTCTSRAAAVAAGVLPAGVNTGALPMFHWVTDFPLFDIDVPRAVWAAGSTERAGRPCRDSADNVAPARERVVITATHHPFTAPHPDDLATADRLMSKFAPTLSPAVTARTDMNTDSADAGPAPAPATTGAVAGKSDEDAFPLSFGELQELLQVRAQNYDLVSNGLEIGGGSIRLHSAARQEAVFHTMGVDPAKFAHLLSALSLGCPPHGGFAAGLDRITAIMTSKTGAPLPLREVIAFPKTLTGNDTMLGAPNAATAEQLAEYAIAVLPSPAAATAAPAGADAQ
jgi:aspartyl-tRNA synthetase